MVAWLMSSKVDVSHSRWLYYRTNIADYPRDYFFTPRTASFAALATRNLTTVLAGILIFCCVFGLKPTRAFLFCFTSLPKPGKTNSPFFLISLYARSQSVSRNTAAVLLLVSVAAASAT